MSAHKAGFNRIISTAVLRPLAHDKHVVLGEREVTHFDVLRAHLLHGITAPADETLNVFVTRHPDRRLIQSLAGHLIPALKPAVVQEDPKVVILKEQAALGRRSTLAAWCDRTSGHSSERGSDQPKKMIKWCEAFR